jgi:hypothetical protein
MDDATKGKLIDGAIVTARATALIGGQVAVAAVLSALHPAAGASHFVRVAIPRPINMWRNQRARRAGREHLAVCIADGHFSYGKFHISSNENGWAFIPLDAIPPDRKGPPINGGVWSDDYPSAEECMRQIDKLSKGKGA